MRSVCGRGGRIWVRGCAGRGEVDAAGVRGRGQVGVRLKMVEVKHARGWVEFECVGDWVGRERRIGAGGLQRVDALVCNFYAVLAGLQ